jgi:Holliday junction resolvase
MVDIKHKKCLEENCNKQPTYNLPDKKIGIYCLKHKKDNMVDIKNKKCLEENCNKQPIYNLPDKKIGIYCLKHKKDNMVDIKSKKCLEENCKKRPNYNLYNKKIGIYCLKHKKDNMVDIKNKKCLECNDTRSTKKYKGYCLRCFIFKFPDVKISKNYKVKEIYMTDFIKEQFKDEVMIFDKTVGGCSKRRPDVYIDKLTHILVIECDENKHNIYEESCENKRTMELFKDFGNRPIIFIRFNPDGYNLESKKILSSFKMHKTLYVPVIRNKKEWENRLNVLKEYMNKHLVIIPEKEVTIEYLFYDKST